MTSVEPDPQGTDKGVAGYYQWFFRNHQGFEERISTPGVNRTSLVFASICEVDGNKTPFQGNASMQVHNVVPLDGGVTIVRGVIGWDSNVDARLSIHAL